MGIVQAQAIMSLDGYVAKQDNTIGRLFDWLQNLGSRAAGRDAGGDLGRRRRQDFYRTYQYAEPPSDP